MSKPPKEFVKEIEDKVSEEFKKAWEDALIHGTGFLVVTKEHEFKCVSPEEAYLMADFIKKQKVKREE